MGSWNETDGITQLPINVGDKVRVFVMVSQNFRSGFGGGGSCYSNELWAPIGPAIQGVYDEYGGVEKIVINENSKMVEDYLAKGWSIIPSDHEWDKVPEILSLSDYLHFIERGRGKFKEEFQKEQELGLMFVHEDIYQAMIHFDCIEAHHNWSAHSYEYMPFSQSLKLDLKGWYENQLENFKPHIYKELDHLYELMGDIDDGRLFYQSTRNGLKSFKKIFQKLAKKQVPFDHEKTQKLVNDILELLRFNITMSKARKQWIPQSGKGSQQNNTDIYQVINAASEKIINDRGSKNREENIVDENSTPDVGGYYPYMIAHNLTLKDKDAK